MLRSNIPACVMLVLVILACLFRVILLHLNWPGTNSDEATIDLMAFHIAYQHEWPIFFWGQGQMGALQAYLGAVLFHFTGPSIFSVRLGLVLIYALYLICLYALTNFLFGWRYALFIVVLCSVGTRYLIVTQLFANGGYAEITLFLAFLFFICSRILRSSPVESSSQPPSQPWKRNVLYMLLGLVIGLAIYTDTLILPGVLAILLLLWFFCRDELLSHTGYWLLAGFFVGILPIILYNIAPPPELDSLHALVGATGFGVARNNVSFPQQLFQVITISLPIATGAGSTCWVREPFHGGSAPTALFPDAHPWLCIATQGSWGLGWLILWSIAFLLAWHPLRKYWRERTTWENERRLQMIKYALRLAILGSGGLSLLMYAVSVRAAVEPASTARYLICLPFVTPVLLWSLWLGCVQWMKRDLQRFVRLRSLLASGVLLFIVFTFFLGPFTLSTDIAHTQASFAQQNELVQRLERLGVKHFYTDYWTCNRLIFQSKEQILCACLDQHLQPGLDRYPPYRDSVRADPHSAYVFQAASLYQQTFEKEKMTNADQYQRYQFDGYVIYVPQ